MTWSHRGRRFLALLGTAALLPLAGLLVTVAERPASAEPQAKKKAKPKDQTKATFYFGRLFRIVVERDPADPEYNTIWSTTRCEYTAPSGATATWPVQYQRIHPANRRRVTLWFSTFPPAAPALVPQPGPPAAPGTGIVVITVVDTGVEDDPTDPIPVEPAEIDPCV